jgi:hypothetical protein
MSHRESDKYTAIKAQFRESDVDPKPTSITYKGDSRVPNTNVYISYEEGSVDYEAFRWVSLQVPDNASEVRVTMRINSGFNRDVRYIITINDFNLYKCTVITTRKNDYDVNNLVFTVNNTSVVTVYKKVVDLVDRICYVSNEAFKQDINVKKYLEDNEAPKAKYIPDAPKTAVTATKKPAATAATKSAFTPLGNYKKAFEKAPADKPNNGKEKAPANESGEGSVSERKPAAKPSNGKEKAPVYASWADDPTPAFPASVTTTNNSSEAGPADVPTTAITTATTPVVNTTVATKVETPAPTTPVVNTTVVTAGEESSITNVTVEPTNAVPAPVGIPQNPFPVANTGYYNYGPLYAENSALRSQIESMQQHIYFLTTENKGLKVENHFVKGEKTKALNALEKAEAENETLQAEISRLKFAIQALVANNN